MALEHRARSSKKRPPNPSVSWLFTEGAIGHADPIDLQPVALAVVTGLLERSRQTQHEDDTYSALHASPHVGDDLGLDRLVIGIPAVFRRPKKCSAVVCVKPIV